MNKKENIGKTNIKSLKTKVAIILVFLLVLVLIVILLIFSRIKFEVINFKFSSELHSKGHIDKDYEFIIKLCILRNIPILKIKITNEKLEKLHLKQKIKNMELKVIENRKDIDKNVFKAIKNIKLKIEKINLNLEIGTENAALTAIIIPVVSTIISIFLRNKIDDYRNQTFITKPLYLNENIVNIGFSGIFEIKVIHIINIIYILNNKEGVKKYERTSNRRSYDYGYE